MRVGTIAGLLVLLALVALATQQGVGSPLQLLRGCDSASGQETSPLPTKGSSATDNASPGPAEIVTTQIELPPVPLDTSGESGRLEVKVMVVAADLTVRPVPKTRFLLSRVGETSSPDSLTTDLLGRIETSLRSGQYSLAIEKPLLFEGRLFNWRTEFEITANSIVTLELANDNAIISDPRREDRPPALNEEQLFKSCRPAVFKILTESGWGSGFLVDRSGLVVTNYHVVHDQQYYAVKIDELRKYKAVLAVTDDLNDLAVLCVNPAAVAHIEPLSLAEDSLKVPAVETGDRVIALGNPLSAEFVLTSGVVSRVLETAILTDAQIDRGSSGGPLLDSWGKVVGVATFRGELAGNISGAVRSYLLEPLIQSARQVILRHDVPAGEPLPVESSWRFPPATVQSMARRLKADLDDYYQRIGSNSVVVVTPVFIAFRDAHKGIVSFPAEPTYDWLRYLERFRPVVTVYSFPRASSFRKMVLARAGVPVEPIHPGRWYKVQAHQVGRGAILNVVSYGFYEYPPEAFRPDADITLEIWTGSSKPVKRKLGRKLVERVWKDFEPYFAAKAASFMKDN